jgi:uncharacterized protein DUF2188
MSQRLRLTVTHSKRDKAWSVKGGGREQSYSTKPEAVRAAASEGRRHGHAQVVIHGVDGKIKQERTYGADPRRTKG